MKVAQSYGFLHNWADSPDCHKVWPPLSSGRRAQKLQGRAQLLLEQAISFLPAVAAPAGTFAPQVPCEQSFLCVAEVRGPGKHWQCWCKQSEEYRYL